MSLPDSTPPNAPAQSSRNQWAIGFVSGIGCIVMVVPLALAIGVIADQFDPEGAYLGLMVVALFGLSQWVFALPLGFYLRYRGKLEMAMGLWITAGVATLLNGACFGLLRL